MLRAPSSAAAASAASSSRQTPAKPQAVRSLSSSRSLDRDAPTTPASAAGQALAAAALAALAAAALPLAAPAPPAALAAAMPNSPVSEGKTLAFGPTRDGSIRACQGNLNPNCVSTASTTDLYSPPWRAPLTVAQAVRALERAVPAADASARLVQSADLPETGAAYRAWQAEGVFGPDVFEVVVKPDREPGSADESALVTFRSSATKVQYVFPFQTAVTDGGRQRKRVAAVRAASGFSLIGCSEIECFIE